MAKWDRRTRLTAELGLRDRTQAGLASASRGFQGYLSGVNRNAAMAGTAATSALMGNAAFAGTAIAGLFAGAVSQSVASFVRLEKQWAEVTTLLPQMQAQALKDMKGQIDRFARETGTTLSDAYSATYQAVSAGVDPGQTAQFLGVAHQAATAGVTDLTTAVDGLTSAINAYGLETTTAMMLSDQMFTAVRLGKLKFEELANTLGLVMPIAAAMNTEFQELTAASAALTAAGNTQAIAVTQIRGALVALSKDTQAKNLFESVTGMSYQEFQTQGGTLQEAMKIIVDEANRMGVSLPQAFGRIEGATAALVLAGEGAETFAAAMADTAYATEEAFDKLADTTDYRMNQIKSNWEQFWAGFGEKTVDSFWSMVGEFQDMQVIWGGMTNAEKARLQQSEDNWRAYARNRQRLQNEINRIGVQTWESHIERQLAGGFQGAPVPGGHVRTQAGPGSIGAWLYGVSQNVGTRTAADDPWALADMNQRFNEVLLGNIRDAYGSVDAGGGGGRSGRALDDIASTNRQILASLQSGQALTVRLDASVEDGIHIRADTVQRDTRQIAARWGNTMPNRVRSG